jgi:two-component system nitrogen regulation response regulator NtrX
LIVFWCYSRCYSATGYSGEVSGNERRAEWRAAIEAFHTRRPQLVVTDSHLGTEVIEPVRQEHPEVAIIVVSGDPMRQGAIEALKRGAFYLTTPFDSDELLLTVERGLERRQLLIQRRWCQEHHGGASRPSVP